MSNVIAHIIKCQECGNICAITPIGNNNNNISKCKQCILKNFLDIDIQILDNKSTIASNSNNSNNVVKTERSNTPITQSQSQSTTISNYKLITLKVQIGN